MNIRQARKVLVRTAGNAEYGGGRWHELDNGQTIARMRRRFRALARLRRKLGQDRPGDDECPF